MTFENQEQLDQALAKWQQRLNIQDWDFLDEEQEALEILIDHGLRLGLSPSAAVGSAHMTLLGTGGRWRWIPEIRA